MGYILTVGSQYAAETNWRYEKGTKPVKSDGEPARRAEKQEVGLRVQVLVAVELSRERVLRLVGADRVQAFQRRTDVRKHRTAS